MNDIKVIDYKYIAEEVTNEIRAMLVFGSNSRDDIKIADFRRGIAIRASINIDALINSLLGNVPNFPMFTKLSFEGIRKYGYGQCGEQAEAAFFRLIEKDIYPIDFCLTTKGTHNLLVLGRAIGSDKDIPSTWGKNVFICDPWISRVYPLSEFKNMQKNTCLGQYNNSIYNIGKLDAPPHYLSGSLHIQYSIENQDDLLIFKQNIKLAKEITKKFKSKTLSEEELQKDLEIMKSRCSILLNSELSSNYGRISDCILKIKDLLESLQLV